MVEGLSDMVTENIHFYCALQLSLAGHKFCRNILSIKYAQDVYFKLGHVTCFPRKPLNENW